MFTRCLGPYFGCQGSSLDPYFLGYYKFWTQCMQKTSAGYCWIKPEILVPKIMAFLLDSLQIEWGK